MDDCSPPSSPSSVLPASFPVRVSILYMTQHEGAPSNFGGNLGNLAYEWHETTPPVTVILSTNRETLVHLPVPHVYHTCRICLKFSTDAENEQALAQSGYQFVPDVAVHWIAGDVTACARTPDAPVSEALPLFGWYGFASSPALEQALSEMIRYPHALDTSPARRPTYEQFLRWYDTGPDRFAVMCDLAEHVRSGKTEASFWGSEVPPPSAETRAWWQCNGTTQVSSSSSHGMSRMVYKDSDKCLLCCAPRETFTEPMGEYLGSMCDCFSIQFSMRSLSDIVLPSSLGHTVKTSHSYFIQSINDDDDAPGVRRESRTQRCT